MQVQNRGTAQLSSAGSVQGQLSYLGPVAVTQARKTRNSDKRGRAEREGSVLCNANNCRWTPKQTSSNTTMCCYVEPLQSTDKCSYFLPGCKLIRPQKTHVLLTGLCGAKETWLGSAGARQEKQGCGYQPQINSYFTATLEALFDKSGK